MRHPFVCNFIIYTKLEIHYNSVRIDHYPLYKMSNKIPFLRDVFLIYDFKGII